MKKVLREPRLEPAGSSENSENIWKSVNEKDRNGRGGESLCWRQGREAHCVVLVEAQ